MDVTLGPWTAVKSDDKPLAEAMGDEARRTVTKAAGFTPKDAPKGNKPTKGYGISGRLTNVVKRDNAVQIFSTFTILVDGSFSNVPPIQGNATAEGGSTAEDAVRAVTEQRVNKILQTIKTGAVKKAR